jgi:hypothetical protein
MSLPRSWIGVLPSDYDRLEDSQFQPLSANDLNKLKSLKTRECVVQTPNLLMQLQGRK